MASAQWALTMYSTASAMISRLGSEYSMPSWPMAMPSSTAMVLNSGHATGAFDFAGDQLAQVLQVHVARDELGERVGDGDDRFLEVFVLHAGGAPQGTGAGHVAALGGSLGTIIRHETLLAA